MKNGTQAARLLRGPSRLSESKLVRVLFFAIPVLAVAEPKGSVILLLLVAGLSFGSGTVRRRFIRFLRTPVVILLGCLLIWYGVTALWSPDVDEGLWRSLRTLIMAAAGLTVLSLVLTANETDRAALDRALVWSAVLFPLLYLGGMAGCQLSPSKVLPWLSPLRTICDTPPLRHAAIQFSGAALPLTLVLWRRWGAAAAIPFLGLAVAGLAINPKVAAIVALGGGGVAFAAVYFGRRAGLMFVATLCTIAALISPQATAFIVEQPAVRSFAPNLPPSWQHRLVIWEATADQIADRPLLGYGAGFHRYMRTIEGPPITIYEDGRPRTMPLRFHHPHNTFMQVWLEGGVVGALLLAGGFVAFWRMLLRSRLGRAELAVTAAVFVGWFIFSGTDFDPWETRWIAGQFVILLVTAAVVTRTAQAQESEGPSRRTDSVEWDG